MRIAFRVDASRAIGTGHVRRMVALARAFVQKGARVGFVWRDLGLDVSAMLPDREWGFSALPAPDREPAATGGGRHAGWAGVSAQHDAGQTLERLASFAPDWVVIDHYAFGLPWHQTLRAGHSARLLVIDDLADRPLAADMIVDQNFHPDHDRKFATVNIAAARLLAGPAYAMLDDVYANATRYRFCPDIRSIGIFMGGVDAPNMSQSAIEAIDRAGFSVPVTIATTDANPNLEALRSAVLARPQTTLLVNQPHLADFFARHDVQIGAGGGALWERFCIGAPTLAVISAENQRESVPWLADIGAVRMADGLKPEATQAIAAQLSALAAAPEQRQSMMAVGQRLVDGLGTRRIADAMWAYHRGDCG